MAFINIFRSLKPRQGAKPGEALLRGMLLIAVFVVVAALYQRHFKSTMEKIQTRSTVYDQSGLMSPELRDSLRGFAAALKDEYGVELRIQVRRTGIEEPVMDSKTLFVGLDLYEQRAIILLPPLMERALGPEFVNYLRHEHFAPYFAQDDWPLGLSTALRMLWDQLRAVGSSPPTARAGAGDNASANP